VYRKKVQELEQLLKVTEHKDEAMKLMRSLMDKTELMPREGGGVEAILHGDLARILVLCSTDAEDARPIVQSEWPCPKRTKPPCISARGLCAHCVGEIWLRGPETTESEYAEA
jgi:hypothetical protein